MKDPKARAIFEKAELDGKILRLDTFLRSEESNTVPADEIARMARQRTSMEEYSRILGERISAF